MALKIAILASGSGTNAQSMIDKAAQGVLDIDIRLIAGNRPGAKVFERAEKAGIPHVCIDHKAFADRESFDREMVAAIKASGAEYVVLAGYMRLLTSTFLQAFPGRVINIHPAILPSFPGAHGGPDAQAYGVKITPEKLSAAIAESNKTHALVRELYDLRKGSEVLAFNPTAVVCATDNIALGLLRYMHEKNIKVPQQISLAGFGGYPYSNISYPSLTTISFDYKHLGAKTADKLLIMLKGTKVQSEFDNNLIFITQESTQKI